MDFEIVWNVVEFMVGGIDNMLYIFEWVLVNMVKYLYI